MFLRKPVLAYPEPGNFEQHVNAFFLQRSGQGWAREAHLFSSDLVRDFLEGVPQMADRIRPARLNGNGVALGAIEQELTTVRLASEHKSLARRAPASLGELFSRGG